MELFGVLDTFAMEGVTLEVMLRFNRLKALSDDEAVVAAALRKSTSVSYTHLTLPTILRV